LTATLTPVPRTARLVHRLAERLDPERRVPRTAAGGRSRRSFLVRAAVVGAAVVTNPLRFVLRPGTAYATVCGDGAGCGTGWTVFCCTVNGGANTCPPGSFAAGWWKADSSAFCGGAARYYIDCNRLPSQPGACSCVSCHSGNGTCDRRRYCCNVFRYGQCHLEIPGVTPVVCRVITCTPPWQWDPACSTSPRTDNRTGSHTAPCLPGPGASAITIKYQDLGMVGAPVGRQVSVEEDAPGGGRRVTFERGQIHWRQDLGAWGSWGPIHEAWSGGLGGVTGFAGYPRSDTRPVAGGFDQDFERASLFWSEATGVQEVRGGILEAYRRANGPAGLGFPLAGEEAAPQDGRRSRFERGVIHWRQDLGAHATYGAILERWDTVHPGLRTILPDTYTTPYLLPHIDRFASWDTVRIDSGDPHAIGRLVLDWWRSNGEDPSQHTLLFSDSLDVRRMLLLHDAFADKTGVAFGWGTDLTNDVGLRPLSLVIKPDAVDGIPCVKLSDDLEKATGDRRAIERYVAIVDQASRKRAATSSGSTGFTSTPPPSSPAAT